MLEIVITLKTSFVTRKIIYKFPNNNFIDYSRGYFGYNDDYSERGSCNKSFDGVRKKTNYIKNNSSSNGLLLWIRKLQLLHNTT